MKVGLFVVCWNEIAILKHMMKYWRDYADHVHVYDNGSDDGCLEEFAKYPDWITVHRYETEGTIDDIKLTKLKNNVWKEYRDEYDLVIVCDFDEVLYSPDVRVDLQAMMDMGATIARPKCCSLCCEEFPLVPETGYLHEAVGRYVHAFKNDKCLIFNPKEIQEISYSPGAHTCSPRGNVVKFEPCRIVQFHCKYIGVEYSVRMNERSRARLCMMNRMLGYGSHYLRSDNDVRKAVRQDISRSNLVKDLF